MPSGMKGLTSFVSDIRNCQSKDAERKRVEKELAKIRVKFSSDKSLSGYDRKKYVWKLLYSYMLGYPIDFGHIQAINLCSSVRYSEKVAGYLACTLLLADSPDILRLIINVCKADLVSKNDNVVALALHTLANVGGAGAEEFAENLYQDVNRIFSNPSNTPYVKRKAALCLLRLHRKDPELLMASEWVPKLSAAIGQVKDLGLANSAASLFIGILETGSNIGEWADCLRSVVLCLSSLVMRECGPEYLYYGVPAPWLQVKLLRIFQFYKQIDPGVLFRVNELLGRIVKSAAPGSTQSSPAKKSTDPAPVNSEKLNKMNAEHAVLFEAINLVVHLERGVDVDTRRAAASWLGSCVASKEANLRYLGLEAMARLAQNFVAEDVVLQASEHKLFDKYKSVVAAQLHEPDGSIRRQALNLLYVICDSGNWQAIVDELLDVLSTRDQAMEEELVLKIAILAEANAPDPTWYIDVVFKMFEYAPDSVGEDVWFRLIQIAGNGGPEVQLHAAEKAYEGLGGNVRGKLVYPHDSMMRLAVYLLGEFGHNLVYAKKVTSLRIVELIRSQFARMSPACKSIALTAYAKILNASPGNKNLMDEVCMHIEALRESSDPDLQQRACEHMALISFGSDSVLEQVLAMMPALPESTRNPLVNRLKMQNTHSRAAGRTALEVAAKSKGGVFRPAEVSQVVGKPDHKFSNEEEESGSESSSSEDSE